MWIAEAEIDAESVADHGETEVSAVSEAYVGEETLVAVAGEATAWVLGLEVNGLAIEELAGAGGGALSDRDLIAAQSPALLLVAEALRVLVRFRAIDAEYAHAHRSERGGGYDERVAVDDAKDANGVCGRRGGRC
jgi:hypothetical protein